MKNIHILPTDKPSTLYEFGDVLVFTKIPDNAFRNKDIYITNDEKIKKHDWCFNLKTNKVIKVGHYGHYSGYSKKIILTTDQDLIKDGVQAIDDEFFEWFVENPTCEIAEVKDIKKIPALQLTGNNHLYYEIIITKEDNIENKYAKCTCSNSLEYSNCDKKCVRVLDEQETIKEDLLDTNIQVVGSNNVLTIKEFLTKHKCKTERIYSEEEVLKLFNKYFETQGCGEYQSMDFTEWFEEFKKK